jgi:tetratricopeptide (TPR) repeat protein
LAALAFAAIGAVALFAWQQLTFEGDTTHGPALTARDVYWEAAMNALASDPLTGAGPNMYPVHLMEIWSTPPARPYLHAHSAPFQVAAESGLLGLAALGQLIGLVVWRAKDAWRALDGRQRGLWAAAAAALVGLFVHSFVDDFFAFPAFSVTAMVLLAFVLQSPPEEGSERGSFQPMWLAAPGLAALVFTVFVLRAHAYANRAVEAGATGDWQTAAAEMQAAAEADPGFAFYWLQLAYAYGRLGESERSIEAYERGIAIEPVYALNYVNNGVLYWSERELEQANEELMRAYELAPESALIALNLGLLEEELSRSSAEDHLVRALELDPRLAGAALWRTTAVREAALAQFLSNSALSEQNEAIQNVMQARAYLDQGNPEGAQNELAFAYELNDQSVLVYVGLAELALAQGDFEEARTYIDAALWVQAVSNHDKVEAILLAAEIAAASGDSETALQRYEAAYRSIMAETSYGWGAQGWSPYAWFVFQRRAFAEDVLPMVARADIATEIAERLLPLAELYDEAGRSDEAVAVRESLAEYLQ